MIKRKILPKTFDLSNKRILISGAAGSIGKETAKLCSEFGASTILLDIKPVAHLEELRNKLSNVEAIHQCDISNRILVEQIIKKNLPIDTLIDTAAICPFNDDWLDPEWNENSFFRVIRTNLLGPINLVRALLPEMINQKKGTITLCGSIAGWMGGLRAGPHYVASKGGIHSLVKWFSNKVTKYNIRVNAVAPGPVDTDMIKNQQYDIDSYPLKRLGTAEEIANTLVFISSPAASFVVGNILDVNGGIFKR